MKYVALSLLCLLPIAAWAQDQTQQPPPPPEYGWKHELVSGLTLTQVSFKDWTQGGENALAYTVSLAGKSTQDMETTNWETKYNFAFGQTRLGSQGIRKTDDLIDISSVFIYKLGILVNPYASASLKTQFATGYVYDNAGNGQQVSKFFDPGYLTQSIGCSYQPAKEVKTRLGFGLREVFTHDFPVPYTDDPGTPAIEKSTTDGGVESVTNVDWPLDDNILFTSQLELFGPVKDFKKTVTRNTTSLTAKINKYMTAILSAQFINEPKSSPRTQIKETIALGLSYAIF